jgi:hypothetical protein
VVALVITLQLLLLLPALPLVAMSQRTSRAHRSRHQGFVALATAIGLLSTVLGLTSLALAFDATETVGPLLSFVPPVLTIGACAFVLRRGVGAQGRRRSRR